VNNWKDKECNDAQIPFQNNGKEGNLDGLVNVNGKSQDCNTKHGDGEWNKGKGTKKDSQYGGTASLENVNDRVRLGVILHESLAVLHVFAKI
jgi:hypothetical protein